MFGMIEEPKRDCIADADYGNGSILSHGEEVGQTEPYNPMQAKP